jgi:beta-glucosidase
MGDFPDGFQFGLATSAYQIEGAAALDGRTPSVWDTFCRKPGTIADGSTGDVACDHYHRWAEDVALMADLGVDAYRLSVCWSRVQPDAGGAPNEKGLDFYSRLVDALLESAIQPVVTLFHWDLPQWVQDAGGWRRRDTADRFAEYAAVVAARLGDRVGTWSTINELFEHFALGHLTGEHAPGLTLWLADGLGVAHHLLLAHGRAVQVLRGEVDAPIMGITSYAPAVPAADGDHTAAQFYDVLQNRLFTEPILQGTYPDEVAALLAPFTRDRDLELIAAPLDYWGVNYYSVNAVRAVDRPIPLEVVAPAGYHLTDSGWAVSPSGLTDVLVGLHERYGEKLPPLVVSETGCAYADTIDATGQCHDPDRVTFLAAHIDAMTTAIRAGVDIRGFYVWSLLDNFEWAQGYTRRFGLVHVDFSTGRRTPKSSFTWYQSLIDTRS